MRWILFALIAVAAFSCQKAGHGYFISFNRVDGLDNGSMVLNRGITIGKVKRMDIAGNRVIVEIRVDDKYPIPANSVFSSKDNF